MEELQEPLELDNTEVSGPREKCKSSETKRRGRVSQVSAGAGEPGSAQVADRRTRNPKLSTLARRPGTRDSVGKSAALVGVSNQSGLEYPPTHSQLKGVLFCFLSSYGAWKIGKLSTE